MEKKAGIIKGRDLLVNDIPVRVKVSGSSMLPLIRNGDYVVVRSVCEKELKIGDILAYTYSKDSPVICHRLVRSEKSYLIAKGDTYVHGYERICFNRLLGRVVLIEHGTAKINLEAGFQKSCAAKIAWLSLRLPVLLYLIAYTIEVLRNPKILLHRVKCVCKEKKFVTP